MTLIMKLTLSSFERDLAFHKNSAMPTNAASNKPSRRTTKTPPTLAKLSSVTADDFLVSSVHLPPPLRSFHHFSLKLCNFPASCSCRMPDDSTCLQHTRLEQQSGHVRKKISIEIIVAAARATAGHRRTSKRTEP